MSGSQLGNLLLACSVLVGAAGHTLLKKAVTSLPAPDHLLAPQNLLNVKLLAMLGLALLLLLVSFGAWLGAIRHLDLSYAYSVASGAIVLVAVLAALFLGEAIGLKAWLGIALIIIGCVLVAPAYAGTR